MVYSGVRFGLVGTVAEILETPLHFNVLDKEIILSHNNISVRIIGFLKDVASESSILTTAFKENGCNKVNRLKIKFQVSYKKNLWYIATTLYFL